MSIVFAPVPAELSALVVLNAVGVEHDLAYGRHVNHEAVAAKPGQVGQLTPRQSRFVQPVGSPQVLEVEALDVPGVCWDSVPLSAAKPSTQHAARARKPRHAHRLETTQGRRVRLMHHQIEQVVIDGG